MIESLHTHGGKANEKMNELLRNDILVEDSTCVVRYNSLGNSGSPHCNYRSPTQDRVVCEEVAAVSALSGKMIHGTLRFYARGASQNGHNAPTIRSGSCGCHLLAALLVRATFPIRSSARRRSRPSYLGARSGGGDLGGHRFVVDRCPQ